jgi:hypothetical protein
MKVQITSNVINGNLKRNRSQILETIKSFEGKDVLITFEKPKKKRSNNQNSYYWGIVIVLIKSALKDTGNNLNTNDVHDLLRLKFLKETISIKEETGEVIERVKSTTELTTSQFMDYIAEIQQFAAEYFDVIIPDPNTEIILNFD